MDTISGELNYGEAAKVSPVLAHRLTGSAWWPVVAYIAVILAGVYALPIVLDLVLPPSVEWLSFPIILAYIGGSYWAYFRIRRRRMRRAWLARGVPAQSHAEFRLEADAFVISSELSEVRIVWRGISELMPAKAHWLFVAPGLGYCLPRRFFGCQTDERAFVAAALARMTEMARDRSAKASAFVAEGT